MNLRIPYSTRKQALGGLYEVIDRDTGEFCTVEPLPYSEAVQARDNYKALLSIADALRKPEHEPDHWAWCAKA